jgi:hypothetical protein
MVTIGSAFMAGWVLPRRGYDPGVGGRGKAKPFHHHNQIILLDTDNEHRVEYQKP